VTGRLLATPRQIADGADLVRRRRVQIIDGAQAVVRGHAGTFLVTARSCECKGGRSPVCKQRVAAHLERGGAVALLERGDQR
jgi:hypothetical protein